MTLNILLTALIALILTTLTMPFVNFKHVSAHFGFALLALWTISAVAALVYSILLIWTS